MADRRSAFPELRGVVRDIGHAGEGVVETPRGLVFVAGALPGETVVLREVRREGKVHRGDLAEVVSASPERVEPACPSLAECGGCPLMPLALSAQRERLRDRISKAVGIDAALESVGASLGYRRRARFGYRRPAGSDAAVIGYRTARGHALAAVPSCPVLDPVAARGLSVARDALAPELPGEGELHVAHGESGLPVLWVRSSSAAAPALYDRARAAVADGSLAGVALALFGAGAPARIGEPDEVGLGADGQRLVSPPFGFAQANGTANALLGARVVELAQPDGATVVELYAGAGNLTVALARTASSVLAVEASAEAVASCRANIEARGLRAHVVAADAGAVETYARSADVVVLDPPRKGAREALDAIAKLAPARVVYVSCDPATLARDVRRLGELGFAPDRAIALEMFPHTAHAEAIVRLLPVSTRAKARHP